jgi:hypothetical protein
VALEGLDLTVLWRMALGRKCKRCNWGDGVCVSVWENERSRNVSPWSLLRFFRRIRRETKAETERRRDKEAEKERQSARENERMMQLTTTTTTTKKNKKKKNTNRTKVPHADGGVLRAAEEGRAVRCHGKHRVCQEITGKGGAHLLRCGAGKVFLKNKKKHTHGDVRSTTYTHAPSVSKKEQKIYCPAYPCEQSCSAVPGARRLLETRGRGVVGCET